MKLVFASKNANKVREVAAILGPGFEIADASELPEVEETGDTFEANALLKARSAARVTGRVALADDSGLEVDALGGRPGVLSARYGGPGLDDAGRRRKLLAELAGVPDPERTARFVCAIALVQPSGEERSARGIVEGKILFEDRGTRGFGYDPLFLPDGQTQTFGELPDDVKNRISHRSVALAIARRWF